MALPADFHSLPMHWSLLLVVGWVLVARVSVGQSLPLPAEPPPGGYELREVEHLLPVASPLGGLVPFVQGKLWGCCDTLGRVWIKPQFAWPPSPLIDGIGQVQVSTVENTPGAKGLYTRAYFNARGEVLRPSGQPKGYLVVRHADGSLHRVRRQRVDYHWVFSGFRLDAQRRRLVPDSVWVFPARYVRGHSLGPDRGIVFRNPISGLPKTYYNSGAAARGALVDGRGRRLTRFAYQDIEPFRGNLARYRLTGFGAGPNMSPFDGWGLLDRQGREVQGHEFSKVALPCCGRAAVSGGKHKKTGAVYSVLLDSTGQSLGTWPHGHIWWAIPGAIFEGHSRSGSARLRTLYDRDGRPLFQGRGFQTVQYLRDEVAAAQDSIGRWGLIDGKARWLAPCQYDKLIAQYNPDETCHRCGGAPPGPQPNEAVAVRRSGKWGVLRVADGQEVVPLRYDTLIVAYQQGWTYAWRGGLPYVLHNGRELVQAQTQHYPTATFQRLLRDAEPRGYLAVETGRSQAVIDSLGHFVCPWYEAGNSSQAPRYMPESGLTLAPRQQTRPGYQAWQVKYAILDGQGREVVPFQDQYDQAEYREGVVRLGCCEAYSSSGQQLVPFARRPTGSEIRVELLPGGWALTEGQRLLVSKQGKRYEVPGGTIHLYQHPLNALPPFTFHYLHCYTFPKPNEPRQGILMEGGRLVWFN